jgi:hypothetical protein
MIINKSTLLMLVVPIISFVVILVLGLWLKSTFFDGCNNPDNMSNACIFINHGVLP